MLTESQALATKQL